MSAKTQNNSALCLTIGAVLFGLVVASITYGIKNRIKAKHAEGYSSRPYVARYNSNALRSEMENSHINNLGSAQDQDTSVETFPYYKPFGMDSTADPAGNAIWIAYGTNTSRAIAYTELDKTYINGLGNGTIDQYEIQRTKNCVANGIAPSQSVIDQWCKNDYGSDWIGGKGGKSGNSGDSGGYNTNQCNTAFFQDRRYNCYKKMADAAFKCYNPKLWPFGDGKSVVYSSMELCQSAAGHDPRPCVTTPCTNPKVSQ